MPASDRASRPARPSRPVAGPAVRLTAGRPVDLASGGESDLLFNPAADVYGQPLYTEPVYSEPDPVPSRRNVRPDRLDRHYRPDEDRPVPYEPGLDRSDQERAGRRPARDARMDTAEYASPLYASLEGGPATSTRPRRQLPASHPPPSRSAGPHADLDEVQPGIRGGAVGGATRGIGLPGRPTRDGGEAYGDEAYSDEAYGDEAYGDEAYGDDAQRTAGRQRQPAKLRRSDKQRQPGKQRLPGKQSRPGEPRQRAIAGGPKARIRSGLGLARTRAGRRLSRKMLVIGVAAAVVLTVVVGVVVFWPQPSHVISAPATLGNYTRQRANPAADALKQRIMKAARGDVKNVVAAGYVQKSAPGTATVPQVVLFIGGNLTGGATASSLISAYMTELRGAFTTSPGRLGGRAACAPGSPGVPAECAWADGDTFGVVVSAALSSTALANEMRLMRPLVEHVAR